MTTKPHVEQLESRDMPSVTLRPGLWSDPTVWDTPPAPSEHVTVNHFVRLDHGEAGRIDVNDALWLDGDLEAHGSVVVNRGGLLFGVRGAINFHVPDDRAFVGNTAPGPNPADPDDHSNTDIGLWGMDGSVILLAGPYVTPYVSADIKPGASVQPLAPTGQAYEAISAGLAILETRPQGWLPGDQLLLLSPRGDYWLAMLVAQTGDQVTFTGADDFTADAIVVEGRTVLPRIANLSRRLVISSADVREDDPNHRARTVFGPGSEARLRNVELRDLGPRAKLGRYPVHYHHTGHVTGGLVGEVGVTGSSIWQSVTDAGSRFVSIHGDTTGIVVENNVALRSQGHGYFLEDGREVGNTFRGNLSVDVRGPEEILTVKDRQSSSGSSHYWLREGNVVENNVAYQPPKASLADVRTVTGTPVTNPTTALVVLAHRAAAPHAPVVVNVFESYGHSEYATWTTGHVMTIHGLVSVNAFASAIGLEQFPQYSVLTPQLFLDNPTLLYNGDPSLYYASQLHVSQTRLPTQVQGGLLVGARAIHAHYQVKATFTGTTILTPTLMDPTYWEVSIAFHGCRVETTKMFETTGYGKRSLPPGLVRFQNCVGLIDGQTWTFTTPLTQDYLRPSDGPAFGFIGTYLMNGTRQAAFRTETPLPDSGFVALPSPFVPNRCTWTVTPAGLPAVGSSRVELQTVWSALLPGSGGYNHGLPPGTYSITATTTANPVQSQTWTDVVVLSGQVTTLV